MQSFTGFPLKLETAVVVPWPAWWNVTPPPESIMPELARLPDVESEELPALQAALAPAGANERETLKPPLPVFVGRVSACWLMTSSHSANVELEPSIVKLSIVVPAAEAELGANAAASARVTAIHNLKRMVLLLI
jgi:hypothetical protein